MCYESDYFIIQNYELAQKGVSIFIVYHPNARKEVVQFTGLV